MEGVSVPMHRGGSHRSHRRRVRLAALAIVAAGGAWCLAGGSSALGADSVEAAMTAQPPIVQPGAMLTLAGSGFLPSTPISFTLCPSSGCDSRPAGGATDCQPASVSAQGDFSCTTPVPLDAGAGDWVATATQTFPYNALGAGGACPAPLESAPALPVAPPTTEDPSPCRRQASAVLTAVPGAAPASTPAPTDQPQVVIGPPPPPAPPAQVIPATTPPPATATPQPQPAPSAPPRAVTQPRTLAVAAPLRDLVPGLVAMATGLLLLAATGMAPLPEPTPDTPGAAALAAETLHRLITRATRKSRP